MCGSTKMSAGATPDIRGAGPRPCGPDYFLRCVARYTSSTEMSAGVTPDIRDA